MLRIAHKKFFGVKTFGLVALVAVACAPAQAQVKPIKITGGGFAPLGVSLVPGVERPHTVFGNATLLGKHSGLGVFQITGPDPEGDPLKARFSSAPVVTFVAANGDELVCTYGEGGTGEVTLTPYQYQSGEFTARFVAEFKAVPELSTGRFEGATGEWIMIANSSAFTFVSETDTTPFTFTWQGEGKLAFPKKQK